jgi:hypothetical protein
MTPWFDTVAGLHRRPLAGPATGRHAAPDDPSTGNEIGRIARGGAEDIDAAVTAARGALNGAWGKLTAADRGRLLAPRHAGHRERRGAGRDGGHRCRQAADPGARRRHRARPLLRVLCRRRRQGHGPDHPLPAGLHRLHAARAHRRDGPYRALELPDADHRTLPRRGARHGQCLRPETGGGGVPDGPGLCRSRAAGGLSGWAPSTSSRASARRPARRSPPIPASATSPSPGRSPRAASCRPPPRKTSFPSRWSWAASPRSWSSPMPISTPPCPSS